MLFINSLHCYFQKVLVVEGKLGLQNKIKTQGKHGKSVPKFSSNLVYKTDAPQEHVVKMVFFHSFFAREVLRL